MFSKIKEKFSQTLSKTRENFTYQMDKMFGYYDKLDDDFYDELEELLIISDVGMESSIKIIELLKDRVRDLRLNEPEQVREALKEVMGDQLKIEKRDLINNPPKVFLIIGVNGAGKTTSIGKLSNLYVRENKNVLLAAADTFRAAAIDQLKVWAQRVGVDCIAQSEGSDPASVIYDSIAAAKTRNTDILICDTAGRLHNKVNLMKELEKIKRIISREYSENEVCTLLVLDSTTGQNALSQAKLFKEYAQIDGIILTKLDGTSKGGFIFSVKDSLNVPVYFMTTGEKVDDIEFFDEEIFIEGFFEKV